jgi:hypothetical protein
MPSHQSRKVSIFDFESLCSFIDLHYRASSAVSNTFSFIFGFQNGVSLRKVLPSTAEEATALVSVQIVVIAPISQPRWVYIYSYEVRMPLMLRSVVNFQGSNRLYG